MVLADGQAVAGGRQAGNTDKTSMVRNVAGLAVYSCRAAYMVSCFEFNFFLLQVVIGL